MVNINGDGRLAMVRHLLHLDREEEVLNLLLGVLTILGLALTWCSRHISTEIQQTLFRQLQLESVFLGRVAVLGLSLNYLTDRLVIG